MILRPHLPATSTLACIVKSQVQSYSTRYHPAGLTRLPIKPSRRRLPPTLEPQTRSFSSSPTSSQKSHYEILGVAPTASKADLKKQFYVLSKETHPDMNPNNPHANERFAEISEAYAVLGNPEKRTKYDRDVMPQFRPTPSRSGMNRSSSGTYAGSRPATGLSKRRGTFRGPPPSFYSQGSAANADEQARRDQEAWNRGAQSGQFDPSQYAAPGSWDPTFNPTPVYRTQTAEDARRNTRRAAEVAAAQAFAEEDSQFWAKFVVVSGIVGVGVMIGGMIHRMGAMPRGGMTRADGTRRVGGDLASK